MKLSGEGLQRMIRSVKLRGEGLQMWWGRWGGAADRE